MADTQLQSLTENTTPALTDLLYIVDDPAGTPLSQKITVQNARSGHVEVGQIWNASPADGQTYYFGTFPSATLTTAASVRKQYVLKAATITRAHISWVASAGTTENSSLYVRINNTTDMTLTTTLAITAAGNAAVTGLSQALAVGDYFEIKWVCPTWVTNPTAVYLYVQLLCE